MTKYTIEDVAKEAGVSITTVSRVINGNYPVKKETREKVEETIEKYDFSPNPMARSLINKKSLCLGVIVPFINNMFYSAIVTGIEKYAKSEGYDIFLNITYGDPTIEICDIKKLMNRFVDGIICIDPQIENLELGFFEKISEKIPLICINGFNKNSNLNLILSEDEKGAEKAFEYLISLFHRNIAFARHITGFSCDVKEKIYRKHMERQCQNPIIFYVEKGNSVEIVENTAKMIIKNHNKNYVIGKDVTAIFACNDLMATGILHGCLNLGLKVPEDVSVIGFDNIILSNITYPKLTTIDRNMDKLGEYAAKRAIELINTKKLKCDNDHVETNLIIRDSCKSLFLK